MKSRLTGAILLAIGMVLGGVIGSYDRMAVATASQDIREDGADVSAQLQAIKTQVTEINTLLHSGTLRVVVVINPDMQ
jgi:hypothetical protein